MRPSSRQTCSQRLAPPSPSAPSAAHSLGRAEQGRRARPAAPARRESAEPGLGSASPALRRPSPAAGEGGPARAGRQRDRGIGRSAGGARRVQRKASSRRITSWSMLGRRRGAAGDPVEEVGVGAFEQCLVAVELGLVETGEMASAKRPRIRSLSRVPRCQDRNSRRLRRISERMSLGRSSAGAHRDIEISRPASAGTCDHVKPDMRPADPRQPVRAGDRAARHRAAARAAVRAAGRSAGGRSAVAPALRHRRPARRAADRATLARRTQIATLAVRVERARARNRPRGPTGCCCRRRDRHPDARLLQRQRRLSGSASSRSAPSASSAAGSSSTAAWRKCRTPIWCCAPTSSIG